MALSSSLLSLPYELRQNIFSFAVKDIGTIELQKPTWSYLQPQFEEGIFITSRQLRDEALEAFYKCNTFLWIIDFSQPTKNPRSEMSDPSTYPERHETAAVTPAMPWYYSRLMQHLRDVELNIYLPPTQDEATWFSGFQNALANLVEALDCGSRLWNFSISFSSRAFDASSQVLSRRQCEVLDVLSRMEVPGKVSVRTVRRDIRGIRASVEALQLGKRMKAGNEGDLKAIEKWNKRIKKSD